MNTVADLIKEAIKVKKYDVIAIILGSYVSIDSNLTIEQEEENDKALKEILTILEQNSIKELADYKENIIKYLEGRADGTIKGRYNE